MTTRRNHKRTKARKRPADLAVARFIAADIVDDMSSVFRKFDLLRAALNTAQREGK